MSTGERVAQLEAEGHGQPNGGGPITPEEDPAAAQAWATRSELRRALRSLAGARRELQSWSRGEPGGEAGSEVAAWDAEAEARAYLEDAKQRVDALCRSMLGAIEQEAAALRTETEEAIGERWRDVETAADSRLAHSRLEANRLVEERRARIASLSDSVTRGAARITSRLDDAERVRDQFDRLVRALSLTAAQIAEELGSGTSERG